MRDAPPSLVKWTGSKRSQANAIAALFPKDCGGRYFEPFLGGGAVLYHGARRFKSAIASDIYAPLIDLWRTVKDAPETIVERYTKEWTALQADFPGHFFVVRERFNSAPNGQDLLFLSRTCVNGIIRFNRQGRFNNSIHLSRRGMKPQLFAQIVRRWTLALKNTEFAVRDYAEIAEVARSGDFVYLDPPYANSHNRYAEDLDVDRFLRFLGDLNQKNVLWALSFDGVRGDSDMTYAIPEELYKFRTTLTSGHSAVQKVLNGSIEQVDESLYLNYIPPIPARQEEQMLFDNDL